MLGICTLVAWPSQPDQLAQVDPKVNLKTPPSEKDKDAKPARVDVSAWRELYVLKGHKPNVDQIAFAPTGSLVATGDNSGVVLLWDAATGNQQARWTSHRKAIRGIAFAKDGQTLQAVDLAGQLKRWDVATHKEQATLALKTAAIDQAAFSPDGQLLYTTRGITGSGDVIAVNGNIEVWDTVKGKLVKSFAAHSEMTKQMLFDAEGKTLVTIGTDMRGANQGGVFIGGSGDTIKVWNLAGGKAGAAIPVNLVGKLGLAPDGNTAAVEEMAASRFPIHFLDLAKQDAPDISWPQGSFWQPQRDNLQSRRQTTGDLIRRSHHQDLGRLNRQRTPYAQGPHQLRQSRRVQRAGRLPRLGRHGRRRTDLGNSADQEMT